MNRKNDMQKEIERRKSIAAAIKKYRKEKGLSQTELAALIESNRVSISRYETAEQRPSHDVLLKISEHLGVMPSEIDPSIKKEIVGDYRKYMTEYSGADMFHALIYLLRDNGYIFSETDWPEEQDAIIGKDTTYFVNKRDLENLTKAVSEMFKSMLQMLLSNADSKPTENPDDIKDLKELYGYYDDLHKRLDDKEKR